MTGVMVIAEDEERNVILLVLYNHGNDLAVNGYLAEGRVMIVKEPYLKVMSDGNYGIRVDHLSDIVFLPEYESLIPSTWRPRTTGMAPLPPIGR